MNEEGSVIRPAPERASTAQLAVGVAGVGALAVGASAGAVDLSLVDVVMLLGVAVVLPLALPGRWIWTAAAVSAGVALALPIGAAAAMGALPWILAAGLAAATLWRSRPAHGSVLDLAPVLAAAYAGVAGGALAASRLGVVAFDIHEPIVELTVVHYTYAGAAALVLAARAFAWSAGWSAGRRRWVATAGLVLTAGAPPGVALGFVTHQAAPPVGGAVALTLGGWCVAAIELRIAADRRGPIASRVLLAVSGVAIWIPMVLAVAWAAGQHWDVPALSIPAMAQNHGLPNALAFVLGGLLAWWIADRGTGGDTVRPAPVDVADSVDRSRSPVGVGAGTTSSA
jgi:hypothetical protein